MCLSVPAKIESMDGEMAICSVGGATYQASLLMLDYYDLKIGDYVLLHTGFAIQKISQEEAEETLNLFKEYGDFNEILDEEERIKGIRIV